MKSLSWAVLGLLVAVPSFAADNNIKMVTYFPVPYAAYGDLGVTGTCDVGLMGQCALDAGKSLTVAKATSDSRALNTGSIIVRKGTLGLTPASSVAAGTSITAGSGIGTGVLEFSHDLAVTNINSSRISKARAMNEAQMNSLNMYGHAFPACDAKNHEISWKSLTLGKKSGVFLVCGAGEEVNQCTNRSYKLSHKSECCPSSSFSDTDCYTWEETVCRWSETPEMTGFSAGPARFSLKDASGSCYDKDNTWITGGGYEQTVAPQGYKCPSGTVPGGVCTGLWEDGNYCAYVEDLGSLSRSQVECQQMNNDCTCSYHSAPALWCTCSGGGYKNNGW